VHGGYVQRLLREWASPEGIWPSPEEAPDIVNRRLVDWLATLP
jgi:hypothetical protein